MQTNAQEIETSAQKKKESQGEIMNLKDIEKRLKAVEHKCLQLEAYDINRLYFYVHHFDERITEIVDFLNELEEFGKKYVEESSDEKHRRLHKKPRGKKGKAR